MVLQSGHGAAAVATGRLEHRRGPPALDDRATSAAIHPGDFVPIGVAPTLAASDFYAQAAKRLSPRGVMVMNFSGVPNRYVTHIERIGAAFGGSTLLVPVIADDNLLLFAFRRRIALPTKAKYESRAQRLQSRLTLEFPLYLRRICQGHVLF
jgi:hypothetical protein